MQANVGRNAHSLAPDGVPETSASLEAAFEALRALCAAAQGRGQRELEALERQITTLHATQSEAVKKSLGALEQKREDLAKDTSQLARLHEGLEALFARVQGALGEADEARARTEQAREQGEATALEARAHAAKLDEELGRATEAKAAAEQKRVEAEHHLGALRQELEQTVVERDRLFEELQRRSATIEELERVVEVLSGAAAGGLVDGFGQDAGATEAAPAETAGAESSSVDDASGPTSATSAAEEARATPAEAAAGTAAGEALQSDEAAGHAPESEAFSDLPPSQPLEVFEPSREPAMRDDAPSTPAPFTELGRTPTGGDERAQRAADAAWEAMGPLNAHSGGFVDTDPLGSAESTSWAETLEQAPASTAEGEGAEGGADLDWINEQLRSYVEGEATAPSPEPEPEPDPAFPANAVVRATPGLSEARDLTKEEVRTAMLVTHQPYTVEEISRILSLEVDLVRERLAGFLAKGWIEVEP